MPGHDAQGCLAGPCPHALPHVRHGKPLFPGAAEPSGEDEAAATQEWAEPPRQPQQAPEVFAQDAAAVMGMDAFASAGIQFKEVSAWAQINPNHGKGHPPRLGGAFVRVRVWGGKLLWL